jgi:archaeosine-15-forming tRNA-guanine transglycosylase
METSKLRAAVMAELKEMKRCGMKVPPKAFDLLVQEDLEEYDNMSVSEIADLLIELGGIK